MASDIQSENESSVKGVVSRFLSRKILGEPMVPPSAEKLVKLGIARDVTGARKILVAVIIVSLLFSLIIQLKNFSFLGDWSTQEAVGITKS